MFNVRTQHAEYQFYTPQWKMSEEFNKGEQAVKASGLDNLPAPFINDKDPDAVSKAYEQFKEIAPFLGFTSRTLDSMVGRVNRKPVDTEGVQPLLEYLIKNTNGGGLGLSQHISRTVSDVTLKGRFGLLTELHGDGKELSKADNAKGHMPFIMGYKAEDIINWGLEGNTLKFVVLCEQVKDKSDTGSMFGSKMVNQYRVLMMLDGRYVQRIYSDNNENIDDFEEIEVTFNGNHFDYIPFDFVGAENNDSNCDDAPLWPVVVCNKNHFYNAALDQLMTTNCSMTMTAISSRLRVEEIDKRFPNGITFGTRAVNFFAEGDKIEIIQAKESSAASRNKNDQLENAKQIGAQLIEPSSGGTATEANIKSSGDGSVIAQIAVNVEAAYNSQLTNISTILNSNTESLVDINKKLFAKEMTAQDRAQWVSDIVTGIIPKSDYYNALRDAELVAENRTNKDLESESVADNTDSISNIGD